MKSRKNTRILILWFSIIAAAGAGLPAVRWGRTLNAGVSYVIITKHHGVNASKIERVITNALENHISEIPGIKRMRSSSSFSQSRVELILDGTVPPDRFYLLLRDRVDRAYSRWPDSVQRPQIHSSTGRNKPVFIAAFSSPHGDLPALRNTIEKQVKIRMERIDGIGEISLGGGGVQEIHLELIPEKSTQAGINPRETGGILQQQHLRRPLGSMEEGNQNLGLILDGYFKDIPAMEKLEVNLGESGSLPLGTLAQISYQYREAEDKSRLDGREMVTMYIELTGGANVVEVSKNIRKEMELLRQEGYTMEEVYDLGKEIEESIRKVFFSVILGMISIGVFLFIAFPDPKVMLHLTLSLPLMGTLVISLLSLSGRTIDKSLLAGMAVGIGMMIDSALVITDALYKRSYRFSQNAPPLAVSTITTLIVFLPLVKADSSLEGIVGLALTATLLLGLSLGYYLLFLPAFIGSPTLASTPLSLALTRPPEKLIGFFLEKPRPALILTFSLSLLSLASLVFLPRELEPAKEPGTLFASLEMESGAAMDYVDKKTNAILKTLTQKHPQILSAESRARTGQSQITLRFPPGKISPKVLARDLKSIAAEFPGIFAYIPTEESRSGSTIEFSLTGSDNQILKDLARGIVQQAASLPWVSGGVLHFKENPPAFVFVPHQELLERRNLSIPEVAGVIQWSVQGPVTLKWLRNQREQDLRIFSARNALDSREGLKKLSLPDPQGGKLLLNQLGEWKKGEEPSRITHENRQRAVQFSLITEGKNLKILLRQAKKLIQDTPLPSGYGLFYDRRWDEKKTEYRDLGISLLTALFLIYAVMAVQGESLFTPLVILAVVPLSLALPLGVYALTGKSLGASTLTALVMLCGMGVNNAILILAAVKQNKSISKESILAGVKARYRSLTLTTGTTLLGTLPLLLRPQEGGSSTFDMALVLVLGTAGGFLTSLTLYPAFLAGVFARFPSPGRGSQGLTRRKSSPRQQED